MTDDSAHLRGQAPDDARELMGERPKRKRATAYRFHEDAYGAVAPEGTAAAAKLSDSAIAPIVAAARGYWTATTPKEFDELMNEAKIAPNSHQRTATKPTLNQGHDVLAMPWYSVKQLGTDHPKPKAYQWRPSKQRVDPDGQAAKYEFPPGPKSGKKNWVRVPLDIHPATPVSWADNAPKILFAEGMLKGDAALSAYLAWAGADSKLLGYTGADARAKLIEFMETIDEADRVLIVRPTSVTTFLNDSALLKSVDFEDREIWVGVDGDVDTNAMVWDEATRFFDYSVKEGASNVLLLAPKGQQNAKDGIDDFLSHTGDWNDLLGHLSPNLPVRPESDDDDLPEGAWRIAEGGTHCEVKRVFKEEHVVDTTAWVPTNVNYGARITSYIIHRDPTDAEMRSGILDEDKESPQDMVELRFRWKQEGAERTADVQLPMKLLMQTPDQWARNDDAWIPRRLAALPGFPPRGSDGIDFMDAVRRASTRAPHQVHWRRNGWVPVPDSSPAFIVGDDVIAADEQTLPFIHSGVTTSDVGTYSQFGIGGPPDEFIPHPGGHLGLWKPVETSDDCLKLAWHPDEREEAADKQAQIAEDIARMKKLLFDDEPFTYLSYPAIVLATAMRPLLVTDTPRASLYIYGEKGRGKTMTAEFVMNFWASESSGFKGKASGAVIDTPVVKETSVARMPIWLMDDLAPTGSQQAYEKKMREVAEIIRNVFNRAGKGRSTINLKARELNMPYAQLIVTAENPLTDPSASDRTIRLPIRNGTLSPKDEGKTAAVEDEAPTGLFARITRHFAEWTVQRVAAMGWTEFRAWTEDILSKATKRSEEEILARRGNPDTVTRDARIAAELMTTLLVFEQFLKQSGVVWEDLMAGHVIEVATDEDDNPTEITYGSSLEELTSDDPPKAHHKLVEAVWDHIAEMSAASAGSSPGSRLMTALRTMLYSGRAHIANPSDPGMPPILPGDKDNEELNSRAPGLNASLGWTGTGPDGPQPRGDVIGELVEKDSGYIVILDPQSAFSAAERNYRGDLIKGGETGDALWESLVAKGYTTGEVKGINKDTGGRRWWKAKVGGKVVRGVPIFLNTLIDGED